MDEFEMTLCMATERNPRYGEGSAIVLNNGDVLLAYGEFYTVERGDAGAAHLLGRISSDKGRSWGEPFVLVDNDAATIFSASLLRLPTDRILLGYLRKEAIGLVDVEKGANCIPWFRSSDNEGQTWSEPWRMDAVGDTEYVIINNDRLIRHSCGRLIAPAALLKPRKNDPYYCTSTSFYSDDAGQSWHRAWSELELDAMDGLQEPAVVELRNGDLMMLMRTSLGYQYRSRSSDRGITWCDPTPVPELISPVSPASIKRLSSTGDLIALFNKNYKPNGRPCGMGLRTPLTAAISQDDGATWTLPRNLETDPTRGFDYTSITLLDGDEVMLTYHNTEYLGREGHWYRHFKLRIVPEAWFYQSPGTKEVQGRESHE